MSRAPEEAWFHQRKDGSWDWSFDPPLKRYEAKMHRMVLAAPLEAERDAALALVEALTADCAQVRVAVTEELNEARAEVARWRAYAVNDPARERDELRVKVTDLAHEKEHVSMALAVERAKVG